MPQRLRLLGGLAATDVPVVQPAVEVVGMHGVDVLVQEPAAVQLAQQRGDAPARCTSSM